MCYFITATMSPRGDESAVRELAESFGLHWKLIENPNVTKVLVPEEKYFLTTRSYCDCGTRIGSAKRSKPRYADLEEDVEKLRKKGWSEAKIKRWTEQKDADSDRRYEERYASDNSPDSEGNRWINFISQVLNERHAHWIGILLHFYNSAITGDEIEFRERPWLSLEELTPDYLYNATEDTIHTFALRPDHLKLDQP